MSNKKDDVIAGRIARLSDAIHEKLGYYVYRLVDPRDDSTFYIGKGRGNRLLCHVEEAIATDAQSRKLARIRDILAQGLDVRMIFHRSGLTEKEAFEVEGALIDDHPEALNEADGHHNAQRGMMTLEELLAEHDARPAQIHEPVVLININRQWHRALPAQPTALYEKTRQYWRCMPPKHGSVQYAAAVAKGIIREVYAVDGWRRHDMREVDAVVADAPVWRWSFTGAPAAEMQRYVGQSVAHLQKPGARNPIKWHNC